MPLADMVLLFTFALAATAGLIFLSLRTGLARRIVDTPNERSLHAAPVPRFGGVCLFLTAMLGTLVSGATNIIGIIVLATLLCVVSLVDDIYNLPVAPRLSVHVLAAATTLALFPIEPIWLLALVFGGIVWMTNLYNFMDGLDGFSAGMTIFGFGTYALVAQKSGDTELVVISLAISGASAGFLLFNFPPARVFMGDAGAIPIGFLSATLGYLGTRSADWPFWFPILVFSPFIFDATWTVVRRTLSGQKMWQAHRTHCYQRMARSELGHKRTVLWWYIAMAMASASACIFLQQNTLVVSLLLLSWLAAYSLAAFKIVRAYPLREGGLGETR